MRVIKIIMWRFMKSLFARKTNLLWMVVMPLLFTVMFGVLPNRAASSAYPIGVVDSDHSAISQAVVEKLNASTDFSVKRISQDAVKSTLRKLEVGLVVTIPQGYQQAMLTHRSVTMLLTPAAGAQGGGTAMIEEQKLSSLMNRWTIAGGLSVTQAQQSGVTAEGALAQAFIKGMPMASAIRTLTSVQEKILEGRQLRSQFVSSDQQALTGFSAVFIMFMVFSLTGGILAEKQAGTWSRLNASPASKGTIVTGYAISLFLIGWMQYLVMYLAGRYLFNVQLVMNGWIVLTTSLYILAVSGIALTISGIVKSTEQHMGIGSIVTMTTCMIGGAYWPLDIEPSWMQHVAWFVPQAWFVQATQGIILGNVSLQILMWPLIVLVGFATVFFGAGIVQLRYS
jgi:ABC-2 type transport system permease protein